MLDPNRRRLAVRMGPTTSVVRHEVVGTSDRVRRHFVILDTPGLPSNDMVTTPIRGKALNALIAILEERQARLLDEETKVVRRKSDGGELVHLGTWAGPAACPRRLPAARSARGAHVTNAPSHLRH